MFMKLVSDTEVQDLKAEEKYVTLLEALHCILTEYHICMNVRRKFFFSSPDLKLKRRVLSEFQCNECLHH
jgi:hypothetical protein